MLITDRAPTTCGPYRRRNKTLQQRFHIARDLREHPDFELLRVNGAGLKLLQLLPRVFYLCILLFQLIMTRMITQSQGGSPLPQRHTLVL